MVSQLRPGMDLSKVSHKQDRAAADADSVQFGLAVDHFSCFRIRGQLGRREIQFKADDFS